MGSGQLATPSPAAVTCVWPASTARTRTCTGALDGTHPVS